MEFLQKFIRKEIISFKVIQSTIIYNGCYSRYSLGNVMSFFLNIKMAQYAEFIKIIILSLRKVQTKHNLYIFRSKQDIFIQFGLDNQNIELYNNCMLFIIDT